MLKKFLVDKKLVLYNDPRNSPKATFTQVPNRNPIKPVWFLERKFACVYKGLSVFVPVLVLFTWVHNRVGRKHFLPTEQEVNLYCQI